MHGMRHDDKERIRMALVGVFLVSSDSRLTGHPPGRLHLLPQNGDVHVGCYGGIQGVLSIPGSGTGMGGFPFEVYFKLWIRISESFKQAAQG